MRDASALAVQRLPTAVRARHRVGALGDELTAAFDARHRIVMDAASQRVALVLRQAIALVAARLRVEARGPERRVPAKRMEAQRSAAVETARAVIVPLEERPLDVIERAE